MQNAIISIIVPVYNVKEYLNKCVESIVNQSYTALEIILVDDGSTDGSAEICDEWEKKDLRVKVIHKSNGGLSDARNCGLSNANGGYVAFVDSDDYVHKNYIEILFRNMLENKAEISICDYLRIDEEQIDSSQELHNKVYIYEGHRILDQLYENNVVMVIAWNKLYKKELFDAVKYPKGRVHEDEYIIHQLLYQCKRVVYTSCKLYYYVQRKGSITSKLSLNRVADASAALEQRALFFRTVGETTYEHKAWEMWFWMVQRYEERAGKEYKEQKIGKNDYKEIQSYLKVQLKSSIQDARWKCLDRKEKRYVRWWIISPDIVKKIRKFEQKKEMIKGIIVRLIKEK